VQNADVIAAIATPPGRGGVGIVRISGPDLTQIARAIVGLVPRPRRATHTTFVAADGSAIDDGIALYFPAPASYTGEDVLELQGHGGPTVMQMLLRRCLELGGRLAEPGEFTRRAYLNDKLDLAQAEAVVDIIDAATESAARCAMRSLHGEFSRAIHALSKELLELRMWVEASLDFPEDEIDAADQREIVQRHASVRARLLAALQGARQGSILRSGLQVVLAGQPNVGKSSLLNRLAGEEVAIVTPIPGTTRDAIKQTIQVEGVPVNIVDTAGLRHAADEVETIGMQRTWEAIGRADLLLLIVDSALGVTPDDEAIVAALPAALKRYTVFNKIDLSAHPAGSRVVEGAKSVFVSAKTGAGIDDLRRALLEVVGWQPSGEGIFMARERHIVALQAAAKCLEQAGAVLDRRELLAEELRRAHESLSTITGEFTADDLLGEIFSRFCIGK
jgi:tRNA modification GTPase